MSDTTMSRSLFIYALFYGGMICIAGVLGAKLTALGPLAVESGIFPFLLLVATSSAVAEVHGQEAAKRLVLYGFVPLVVSILLILTVLALPPASFWEVEKRAAFSATLGQSSRMMIAGIIAYGTSQTLNVLIFDRLRRRTGLFMGVSAMIAGVSSQVVDTLIFVTVAFYGVAPVMQILPGQLLAKIVLSAVMVPLLTYGLVALARRLDR